MSLETNQSQLVRQPVVGQPRHPSIGPRKSYLVGANGDLVFGPAHAAITYDLEIGDNCMGPGDHVEPGVTAKNPEEGENQAFTHLSCVGNEAEILSGKAAGEKGFVTGTHGGIDHVIIWFPQETLHKMTYDDKIMVKAFGQGLMLKDYPQVKVMSIDPALLDKLNIREEEGKLIVPVAAVVPAYLMGSGLGCTEILGGDYDIMSRDPGSRAEFHLDELRFGDLVLIQDHHCQFGPDYLRGSATVGVIVHGDSYMSGHGPGVTPILTCSEPVLVPELDAGANLAYYLGTKTQE